MSRIRENQIDALGNRRQVELGGEARRGQPFPPQVQPFPAHFNQPDMSTTFGASACVQSMLGFILGSDNAQQVLQANPNRIYMYLQNNSNKDILIRYGSAPTTNGAGCFVLGPGGFYEPLVVPTNAVFAISASLSNAALTVIEGVR